MSVSSFQLPLRFNVPAFNPNQPTSRRPESDLRCDELILPEAHLLDVIVFIRGCNKVGGGCRCLSKKLDSDILIGVVLLGSSDQWVAFL